MTSPARTFTVELPEGWVIKPSEPDESWVTFTPSGRDLPSVGIIAWTSAGVLQAIRLGPRAGDDPGLFCRQISAQEFYTQILLPLVRQRAPGVKLDPVTPGAARQAVAEVSGTVQGKAVKALDVVTIEHVPDDTLTFVYRCARTWQKPSPTGFSRPSRRRRPGARTSAPSSSRGSRRGSRWSAARCPTSSACRPIRPCASSSPPGGSARGGSTRRRAWHAGRTPAGARAPCR